MTRCLLLPLAFLSGPAGDFPLFRARQSQRAGSCITKDVAPDALALTRPEQREIPGWAAKKRERQG